MQPMEFRMQSLYESMKLVKPAHLHHQTPPMPRANDRGEQTKPAILVAKLFHWERELSVSTQNVAIQRNQGDALPRHLLSTVLLESRILESKMR